ncbi:Integrator complex subunit 1 [Podila humilis]|nr:Integrator complex subunit 1 [Podila humilis]
MSKDSRKGKATGPERLPDLIPLGRAPSRTIKSSVKLEQHGSKGSLSSSASGSTGQTPPIESLSSSLSQLTQETFEGASIPIQKKARITTNTASDTSTPSTPPKSSITAIKLEDMPLKSAMRKIPGQTNQQHQHHPQQSLWSIVDKVRPDHDTTISNPRSVDDEVAHTFSQQTWQKDPPLHHIRQAIQYLKSNALKPDQKIASGLLRLGKSKPDLFRDPTVSAMMIQMLRPSFTHSFKIRTNGAVVFLVCTLLHQGWDKVPDWPTDFVMAYLEDATGERSWCASVETKQFVTNILTAFRTDGGKSGSDKFDPVRLDEKPATSAVMATIDIHEYTELLTIRKRYNDPETTSLIKDVTLKAISATLPSCTGPSASDTSVRSMIKLLMSTCRWVEVRQKAMTHMEFWLGNFTKSAKPLLRLILRHISSQERLSGDDLETWFMLIDFRYKTRSHQIEPVKEEVRAALAGMAGQDMVRSGLQHIMSAELHTAEFKNPHHLDLMELLLQHIPEKPAVEFGRMIQRCTIDAAIQFSGSGVNPTLAPVVLVVKRWIRHLGKRSSSWNADVLVGLLMDHDGTTFARLAQKQEHSAHSNTNRNISKFWLSILTEVICYIMLANAMDARDTEEIKMCKFSIAHAHAYILRWFQAMIEPTSDGETCRTPFGLVPTEIVRISISRVLFLEPPGSYSADSTTQEIDSTLIYRVVENGLPLTDVGLIALLDVRIPPQILLVMVGDYVARATDLSKFHPESLVIKNPDAIVKIFNLAKFSEASNSATLALAQEIPLAWTQAFWTCSLIVTMLACCSPRILALIVWETMPVLRTLLEICISQHYSFPPPNYTSQSDPSAERVLRIAIQADQKDKELVLKWETESRKIQGNWDNQRTTPLRATESEYVGQLMKLDYGKSQPARMPPSDVMQQLRGLNERYGLGMKLAGSREPDYLRSMVGNNDDAAWVDRLLRDVPGIMNALPASTLCARYCRSVLNASSAGGTTVVDEHGQPTAAGSSSHSAKDSAIAAIVDTNVRKKMSGYLEQVMAETSALYDSVPHDPLTRFQEARDIFEFFLSRLSPNGLSDTSLTTGDSTSATETEARTRTGVATLSEKEIRETKQAMEALFQSAHLKWPTVLARAVFKTPGSGFLSKVMYWVGAILAQENDIAWLEMCFEFLLKVEGNTNNQHGNEQQEALEQSLLVLARLLTTRLFVWEWVASDKDSLLLRLLTKRVDQYFLRVDTDMEDVEMTMSKGHARQQQQQRVQVKLDDDDSGVIFETVPEILWLTLLVLSASETTKHPDGSTWSKLFKVTSQHAESAEAKKLVNGQPLLSKGLPLITAGAPIESLSSKDNTNNRLRQRLCRARDPEIVKVGLDGMTFVQVIDVVKDGLGLDLRIAQVIHNALFGLVEKEQSDASLVPAYLDRAVVKRVILLLQYYADQGGESSQRALGAFKARFERGGTISHDVEDTTVKKSVLEDSVVVSSMTTTRMTTVVPNFFHIAATES